MDAPLPSRTWLADMTLESGSKASGGRSPHRIESRDSRGCSGDGFGLGCADVDPSTADGVCLYGADERPAGEPGCRSSAVVAACDFVGFAALWPGPLRVLIAVLLAGCLGCAADPRTEMVLEPERGLELGWSAYAYVYWSRTGAEGGTRTEVGDWAGGERCIPLASLESQDRDRLPLGELGLGEGTLSIGTIGVEGSWGATAPGEVVLEISADAPEGSWVAQLVGSPLTAGVHLLDVREWTEEEIAELEACKASASAPVTSCPGLQMHLSLATDATVRLVSGDRRPDLSVATESRE